MEIGIKALIYAILKHNPLVESAKILIACTFTVFILQYTVFTPLQGKSNLR